TTLNAGGGSDIINVGSLTPATGGNVNAIAGGLTVNGQGNSDTLNVDDTGDAAANSGTLTSTQLTGLGMGASGITYGTVETLNINLRGGRNTFNVRSTNGPTTTTLNTGGGADIINVTTAASSPLRFEQFAYRRRIISTSDQGGNVNAIAGGLTVNGQGNS